MRGMFAEGASITNLPGRTIDQANRSCRLCQNEFCSDGWVGYLRYVLRMYDERVNMRIIWRSRKNRHLSAPARRPTFSRQNPLCSQSTTAPSLQDSCCPFFFPLLQINRWLQSAPKPYGYMHYRMNHSSFFLLSRPRPLSATCKYISRESLSLSTPALVP